MFIENPLWQAWRQRGSPCKHHGLSAGRSQGQVESDQHQGERPVIRGGPWEFKLVELEKNLGLKRNLEQVSQELGVLRPLPTQTRSLSRIHPPHARDSCSSTLLCQPKWLPYPFPSLTQGKVRGGRAGAAWVPSSCPPLGPWKPRVEKTCPQH